ncbi:Blp family class II bacteriocin [Bacillus cereus group sp. MYBK65-1]|uniref:Blp family class II bacteriocin n=1 Tax=Bacillus TaxID=1386 RepID=UPI001596BB06|nr:Blp family class II bacteriocin [Bacillus cereus]MDA2113401.1 Blp family class II bacteriocin [Bacillus cereus]MDA2130618.1 Blp family class II bacteriocin [Bacillus cereus]MDA2152926.1 Blp family class II bacteriocin [Bacillus cereus]MDA2440694.1 Blp family class II bacteriocin [Bacillus cereus]MDA2446667.1 Blp family class II bacteriocin [Bacillus cereus]
METYVEKNFEVLSLEELELTNGGGRASNVIASGLAFGAAGAQLGAKTKDAGWTGVGAAAGAVFGMAVGYYMD